MVSGFYADAMTGKVTVSALTNMDDPTAEAIAALLPQLSASAVFDRARLDAMLGNDATTFWWLIWMTRSWAWPHL